MTHIIIDRRSDSTTKSGENRDRYLKRIKNSVQKAVNDAINRRSIKNSTKKGIKVKTKKSVSTDEPVFSKDRDGEYDQVVVGNDKYSTGDKWKEQYEPAGGGTGGNGTIEEGMIELSEEELNNILFEGLELPDFIKKAIENSKSFKLVRAGYTKNGIPCNLDIKKSFQLAFSRRLAQLGSIDNELERLKLDEEANKELIADLLLRKEKLAYFEEDDLRYKAKVKKIQKTSKAAIYFIMDVSGSMTEIHRMRAKLFFVLLYNFLIRCYDDVEIVFVRHTDVAEIVDEQTFFKVTGFGGTNMMSAMSLVSKDIKENRNYEKENIYIAQASDGGTDRRDTQKCVEHLNEVLLDMVQYFCYLQVDNTEDTFYGEEIYGLKEKVHAGFAGSKEDVYTIFREFFSKKTKRRRWQ